MKPQPLTALALACLAAFALSLSWPATAAAPALAAPAGPAAPAAAKPAVTLTYLGVAGWQLSDGQHTVLVDPYFSRVPLNSGPTPIVPDVPVIAAHTPPRADLILVGHSHFDHLLDIPEVARRTGAQVLGTASTAHLVRAAGIPDDHIIAVKGGEDFEFEGFSVRVIPSLHSALDAKHRFGGDTVIPADVKLPLPLSGYVEGGALAYLVRMGGHEILFLCSANFIEREMEGLRPDVAVIATGYRAEIHDYSCRLMRALGRPPLVLANHFDPFTKPLEPKPELPPETRADLARFGDEIHRCAPAAKVTVPETFAPIILPARR
jgi:L-ascorbate metabolism protein UlaG (beta-lactamase superfamily)